MKSFILLFVLLAYQARACECPPSSLSLAECNQYEIIFRGKILSVKDCEHKFGEALFQIDELYKGNATKNFKVLFDCNVPCAQKFLAGEEWIIYTRYKQMENAMMDWCSRSRKYFRNEKEDFYLINYGNDYEDEVKFLRENLGNHRLLAENLNKTENRNELPNTNQSILILVCSLLAILVFYFLFNRFFK